jgi:PAS domain S-box-containing protein
MRDKNHLSIKILSAIGESYALLEGSKNLKNAIECILPKLGEESCVDRAYVFRNYHNAEGQFCLSYLSEWCREGVSAQMDNENLVEVPWSVFPDLEVELRKNQVQNKLVRESTNEAFQEVMSQQEIVAYLFIPIIVNNDFWGFMGFDNCTREELFTSEQVSALHAFANTLGNLIFAKRSLKKALTSKKKYQQLISNIQDIVIKLDEDLNFTYLNNAWSKMTERNNQECIGKPLAMFLVEEGARKLTSELDKLDLSGKRRFSFSTAIMKLNGDPYYVLVNLKKIQVGNRFEFFGTINGAHQSQINFDLLKASEYKLKSLFETVEDVLYTIDSKTGRVLLVSDKIERFGFKKEDLLADPHLWKNHIHPEDRLEVLRDFDDFVEKRIPVFEKEYRIQKPDGGLIWVSDKCRLEYSSIESSERIHGKMSDITDKKNKEIQIEQTENRFKSITENLPFPFILCTEKDFKLHYYNFAFFEIFQSHLAGKAAHPDQWINQLFSLESGKAFFNFLNENPTFSNHEVLLNTKEGPQWFSINNQVIPYQTESARAIVFNNINKRKLSEYELNRMNDFIQAINQTQVDFSMDNEIQDTFYLLLGSLLEFTGSSKGFVGEVLYDEKGLPYVKPNATSGISWSEGENEYSQKNFRLEMEFRNLDSLFGWVLVNKETLIVNVVENDPRRSSLGTRHGYPVLKRFLGIPIFKGEQYVGIVGLANKEKPYSQEDVDFLKPFLNSYANLIVSLNVNRQKRRAESLQKESESLYKIVSENVDDIVTLHDLNFKTIYASPSLKKITGFNPLQFIGKDFFGFFNYKVEENLNFTDFPRFIIPLRHGISGKEVKLEMVWKPIFTDQGELKSYLAASRDVTERELVLEELKKTLVKEIELNQLKSKFISMTSHELRTPLATIQSSADVLEIITEGVKEEEVREGLVKQIRKVHIQLSRLTQIISDVLLTERNSQGKLVYNQTNLDLKSLIIQLVFNQFTISENESKIRLDLGEEPQLLKSDPILLFHVVRNLIENAIKYTQEGSPMPILKLTSKEKFVEIQVVDFGIGIPARETKFVFQTFFRASNVKNIKGTGLGLSIVYDLIQKLGGNMTFSSIEKQGSTFIITIPYERNDISD